MSIVDFESAISWRENYRYSVYEHKLITVDGLLYVRSFIVIKNQYDVIVRFTRLHQLVGTYKNQVFRPITSDTNAKLHYVCKMLNYILITNWDKYRINHVFQISKDMLNDFFRDYAMGLKIDGSHRGKQSVEKCISTVVSFFDKMIYRYGNNVKMKRNDLYEEKGKYSRNGKFIRKKIPAFQVYGVEEHRSILRDMPTKVFEILLKLSIAHYPDIALAIGLQAFAGLRPGEVCNVRQVINTQGPGILLKYKCGELTNVQIDLRHEYPMRSDGVNCGGIKKERLQAVYPVFLQAFETLYNLHLEYLKTCEYEADYTPLFVNSKGMAMTYDDYYGRFRSLTDDYLRPYLLKSEDAECRIYGQLLCENKISPHILRHWYSVQLALRGEDIAQIQFWRGDNNPQSAFVYLQNKGDMIKELERANQFLSELMMEVGEH